MTAPKSLEKIRDELAQSHWDERIKKFGSEIEEFDREIIAVESCKLGFDCAVKEMGERADWPANALQQILNRAHEKIASLEAENARLRDALKKCRVDFVSSDTEDRELGTVNSAIIAVIDKALKGPKC